MKRYAVPVITIACLLTKHNAVAEAAPIDTASTSNNILSIILSFLPMLVLIALIILIAKIRQKNAGGASSIAVGEIECGHMRIGSYGSSEFVPGSNSAGGVSVKLPWRNQSSKTIKYVTFVMTPYNAVNDAQTCAIRGLSQMNLSLTGPIAPNATKSSFWENTWYNSTIKTASSDAINIQYMDGTHEKIEGQNVEHRRIALTYKQKVLWVTIGTILAGVIFLICYVQSL